jgi:hypothetical protein
MTKPLTMKDIEDAADLAIKNFGTPTQIFISNGTTFIPFGQSLDVPHTVGLIAERFVGTPLSVDSISNQEYEILVQAAQALYNIGFDPRPDKA